MSAQVDRALESLRQWWSGLAAQDQRILRLAAPLVLLMLVYLLVLQPIYRDYAQSRDHHQQLSETLVWLYESAELVNRMQNACTRQRLLPHNSGDLRAYIQDVGRRFGASPQVTGDPSQGFQVSLNGGQGSRVLALFQSYGCHGFSLEQVQLDRQKDNPVMVNAKFVLRPAAVLTSR